MVNFATFARTQISQHALAPIVGLVEDTLYKATSINFERPKSAFLKGNFAPITKESTHMRLEVEGKIPADLRGTFVRAGPNQKYDPKGAYHVFDGDGMIHGISISDDGANYSNRWIKTNKLSHEDAVRENIFINVGDMKGASGLARMVLHKLRSKFGIIDDSMGTGRANTAVVAHADKLWALHEADNPYSLTLGNDGAVDTVGRDDFGGQFDFPFTAHPKVDPRTGELLFFGYRLDKPPYCKVGLVDAQGNLKKSFDVDFPESRMMHDCAITENHMILIGSSIVFSPKEMVKQNALPFTVDHDKPMLIGILPRNATSQAEVKWFEAPPGASFHTMNAWENGDLVELYTCFADHVDLNLLMTTGDVTFTPDSRPNLYHFTFNLKTGETTKELVCPEGINIEFPRINDKYLGGESRYGYLANFSLDHSFKMPSAVKVDITKRGEESIIGEYTYGRNCFGGEPVFVPKKAKQKKLEEDDGYLLVLVYDEQRCKSYLDVINAKTMSAKPIARIHIPERVPYGFHATFLPA